MEGILKNPEAREAYLVSNLASMYSLFEQVCDQAEPGEDTDAMRALLRLNRTAIEMTLGVDLGL